MGKTAAIITVSDKGAIGERVDTSGPALRDILVQRGLDVICMSIVPDEMELIKQELIRCADEKKASLILTTGGTGFSSRDVTPEATKAVIEKDVPGISEAMRAASMVITPRGCLSRGISGIRGRSLIVNLPGSKKAATENILSVIEGLLHGLDILQTDGSADCAAPVSADTKPDGHTLPSLDRWLQEAQTDPDAAQCGMYLFHTGTVRTTPKAKVRPMEQSELNKTAKSPSAVVNPDSKVTAVEFSYDAELLEAAVARGRSMPGIYYVRVWLNQGVIPTGDPLMLVLVGGDIRPNVISALQSLVAEIKTKCVVEKEIYETADVNP